MMTMQELRAVPINDLAVDDASDCACAGLMELSAVTVQKNELSRVMAEMNDQQVL